MDTSAIYVKMCDCPEIQGHIPQTFTRAHLRSNIRVGCTREDCHYLYVMEHYNQLPDDVGSPQYSHSDVVWLPRQDQIQEMMRKHYASQTKENKGDAWFPEGTVALTYVLKNFCKWVCENRSHGERTKSFEELWLGFYMWEKYQYFWSHDEKWMKSQLSV